MTRSIENEPTPIVWRPARFIATAPSFCAHEKRFFQFETNARFVIWHGLGRGAAAFGAASTAARANGLVIPAYIPLSDTTNWNILKEGGALAQAGSSNTCGEYWVVVTGPNSGPFAAAAEWASTKTRWDPIRTNLGEVFGYINTMTTSTSSTFRPLADVKRDIDAWVAGYGALDGIWIDEFYPRYEIAGASGSTATFPNGQANAPTDRSFLNPDGSFNANQVNPAGGYYSQLTSYIRTAYPDLKIIGNPGGPLYSNQIRYASLVDVTCSFEQSYALAANAPTNDWAPLTQQSGTGSNAQAALIHTNSSDLTGAIAQSINRGYKYFYTTNRTLNENVWGSLPPYFTSEVNYLYNRN